MKVSVVISVFNERDFLERLMDSLKRVLKEIDNNKEVIYVDGGSRDGSFHILRIFA